MSSIYDWSLFAANNANADDLVNWAEGQPPSSVNNSARAMMQRVREYIADLGGAILAEGTGNAIALTTISPVSIYASGIVIRFRALSANTDAATLSINSLGAKPLFKPGPAGVIALSGGEIQAGALYEVVYNQAFNSGGGGWFLSSPVFHQAIPAGMIAPFAMPSPPEGWLVCDGAEISRLKYSGLFAAIGTCWGSGDNKTTFRLPDLRAVFMRGWDSGRGLDAGRSFASLQDSQNRLHNHGGSTSTNGEHAHSYSDVAFYNELRAEAGYSAYSAIRYVQQSVTDTKGAHSHRIADDGGAEARPVNLAVLYAVKV